MNLEMSEEEIQSAVRQRLIGMMTNNGSRQKAPSLFAPPLGFRLHLALKRGRSLAQKSSFRGGVACYVLA